MESAETYANAIRAAMAVTRCNREKLASYMGIHEDTLGRKLRRPGTLTLDDLIKADLAIRWTGFLPDRRRL